MALQWAQPDRSKHRRARTIIILEKPKSSPSLQIVKEAHKNSVSSFSVSYRIMEFGQWPLGFTQTCHPMIVFVVSTLKEMMPLFESCNLAMLPPGSDSLQLQCSPNACMFFLMYKIVSCPSPTLIYVKMSISANYLSILLKVKQKCQDRQYCVDRGAWWATVHGVTNSWTRHSN